MIKGDKIVIVCPIQDWSVFFAIGAYRIMRERGYDVSIMPKSMAQENIFSNDIDISICDGTSIDGKMLFLAPDPIAERDARMRGIETMGCVADEYESSWSEVSSCWNGQSDAPLLEIYEKAFSKSFYMELIDAQKISKPYTGVAIKSESVRMLVKSAFFVQNLRLWHVPIRQNVMKRLHESCSCSTLITDDAFCAMASYAHGNSVILLRKPCDGLPNLSSGSRLVEQNISEYNA